MTKTHMIENQEAIGIAKEIAGLLDLFQAEEKELQDRFQKEADILSEKFNRKREDLWNDLTAMASVAPCDKEAGFGYEIDLDYAEEHGMIFLREVNDEKDDCDCIACQTRRGEGGGSSLADILGAALGGR